MPLSISYKEWILREFLAVEVFNRAHYAQWLGCLNQIHFKIQQLPKKILLEQMQEHFQATLFDFGTGPLSSVALSKLDTLTEPCLMGIDQETLPEFIALFNDLIGEEIHRLELNAVSISVARSQLARAVKRLLDIALSEGAHELSDPELQSTTRLIPLLKELIRLKPQNSDAFIQEIIEVFAQLDQTMSLFIVDQVISKIEKIINHYRHDQRKNALLMQENKILSSFVLPWMYPLYQNLVKTNDDNELVAFQIVSERLELSLMQHEAIEHEHSDLDEQFDMDLSPFDDFLLDESMMIASTASQEQADIDSDLIGPSLKEDHSLDQDDINLHGDDDEEEEEESALNQSSSYDSEGVHFSLVNHQHLPFYAINDSRKFKNFLMLPAIKEALQQSRIRWVELAELEIDLIDLWFIIEEYALTRESSSRSKNMFNKSIFSLMTSLLKLGARDLLALWQDHINVLDYLNRTLLQVYVSEHGAVSLEMTGALLHLGVDVQNQDDDGQTIFHDIATHAVYNHHFLGIAPALLNLILTHNSQALFIHNNDAKWLIDYVIDYNIESFLPILDPYINWSKNSLGPLSLLKALECGSFEVSHKLIDLVAPNAYKDRERLKCLELAANHGWICVVMKLIPNYTREELQSFRLHEGGNLLHAAVDNQDITLEMMERLIELDIDPVLQDKKGKTVLHYIGDRIVTSKDFLCRGALLIDFFVTKHPNLLKIVDKKSNFFIDKLIDRNMIASINPDLRRHWFELAAHQRCLSFVLKVLPYMAREDVDSFRSEQGGRLLHAAIYAEDITLEMIDVLLEFHRDLSIQDAVGKTILHYTLERTRSSSGFLRIAIELINRFVATTPILLQIMDNSGRSCMHLLLDDHHTILLETVIELFRRKKWTLSRFFSFDDMSLKLAEADRSIAALITAGFFEHEYKYNLLEQALYKKSLASVYALVDYFSLQELQTVKINHYPTLLHYTLKHHNVNLFEKLLHLGLNPLMPCAESPGLTKKNTHSPVTDQKMLMKGVSQTLPALMIEFDLYFFVHELEIADWLQPINQYDCALAYAIEQKKSHIALKLIELDFYHKENLVQYVISAFHQEMIEWLLQVIGILSDTQLEQVNLAFDNTLLKVAARMNSMTLFSLLLSTKPLRPLVARDAAFDVFQLFQEYRTPYEQRLIIFSTCSDHPVQKKRGVSEISSIN